MLSLFAASGCAALIYQVVWFERLALAIGSSALSLGVLLATFMSGLSLGSWIASRGSGSSDGALRYDASAGHFAMTWKTPKVAGEACYRVTMTTRDGSALHAFVRATR